MSKVLEKVLKVQQGKSFKGLKAVVPETNIWGRPTPKKRIPNILWRNHSRVMKAALPPLPLDEFQRLEGLALGTLPLSERRVKPKKLARPPREMRDAHHMTPRRLRRTYCAILEETTFWNIEDDGSCTTDFSRTNRPRIQASPDELLDASGNTIVFTGVRTSPSPRRQDRPHSTERS